MATEKTERDSSTDGGDERRSNGRDSGNQDEHRFARNLPEDGGTVPEQEYQSYAVVSREGNGESPDVLLDVPVVKVDEINFELEDLRAHVSLQAEVLDLLKLNVGADVSLGRVALEIKGVEAQALLKVRLDNVAAIVDRVLTTIDRNPQILENITQGLGNTVEEVGQGARKAVSELGEGAGSAVEDVGEGAGSAVEDVGEGAGSAVEDVGEGAGSAVEDVGEGAGEAVEDVGETVEEVGEDAGDAARGASESVGQAAEGASEAAGNTAQGAAEGAGKAAPNSD